MNKHLTVAIIDTLFFAANVAYLVFADWSDWTTVFIAVLTALWAVMAVVHWTVFFLFARKGVSA